MKSLIERIQKLGARLIGLAALALVVLVQFADPEPLARVRMLVFDTYQSLSPRDLGSTPPVAIIDIDEASIAEMGQWPWPRTDLARLTDRLGQAGATAVVFDVVFSEPDRTSPEEVADRLRSSDLDNPLIDALAQQESHDSQLAESFENVPVVTALFLTRENLGRDVEPKAPLTISGSLPSRDVQSYEGSLQALPELEQAAAGNGFVSLIADADGIVRRVPLVAIHRGGLIPSLSLEALRVKLDSGSPNLLASDGSGETLDSPGSAVAVRISDLEIPTNDAGEMWVHFPDPNARALVPAAPIITGAMNDQALAEAVGGKIVLVGGSATGLQDLVSTPLSDLIAGVTVHAAALDHMLAGEFLQRPDWAFGLELVLVLVLGIGFALILPRMGALFGALAVMGGIALVFGSSWLGFAHASYLFDPTYPVIALALIYTLQTVVVYYREEQKRSYIHSAFDRFLSPELVRQIASDPGRLELGGEERDMSVLMCDVRGFSRISEQYSPTEVIDFLIEFLTPMSDILMAHKATLDKYIGDAILAFWNAPLDDPDHHKNAARSALAMGAKLNELNQTQPNKRGKVWPGEVKIGIGLNSGLCCVGNMGSKQRLAYSLIGDTVNVAARLEGLTKQYGVQILVGESLAEQLDGFALLEVDRVRVVGREGAERIFGLLGDEAFATDPAFEALTRVHADVLKAYRAQSWEQAASLLTEHHSHYGDAGVPLLASLFESRIRHLSETPPESEWDGVFQATAK